MAVQTCTQLVEIGLLLMMLCLSFEGKPCSSEWGAILELIFNLATAILHSNNWDPTAVQTCMQLVEIGLLLMMLHLSFGGKPCPSEWGAISESICDLATVILHSNNWDPVKMYAPNQHLLPPKITLNNHISFGQGKELVIDIPINPRGMHDIYIDVIICLTLDILGTDHVAQGQAAALLAINATAFPNHPSKPIPQESVDARDKLLAEAGLSETKAILGWFFDFRKLQISLPKNKFIAWMTNASKLIAKGAITAKEHESMIGQLGHLALVVPGVHHFLSRLQELQQRATHRRSIQISDICWDDLTLMLCFLYIAKNGIDMNLIMFRQLTHIYQSDSCSFGLGGYSEKGFAWRFKISEDLLFWASNNLLEYITSMISPWVDMLAGRLKRGGCALSMTDSSTSVGWLCKTNFWEFIVENVDPVQSRVRIDIAHHHVTLLLKAGPMWPSG
jgi:hypothetical protein